YLLRRLVSGGRHSRNLDKIRSCQRQSSESRRDFDGRVVAERKFHPLSLRLRRKRCAPDFCSARTRVSRRRNCTRNRRQLSSQVEVPALRYPPSHATAALVFRFGYTSLEL